MDKDVYNQIGKRIGEIRRSNGMTQETLAGKLSVSPKHISHAECGTSSLSLKNLIQFSELFHCSLDYIVFGEDSDSIRSKLPNEIVNILHTGTDIEIDRLMRYLQVYVELSQS